MWNKEPQARILWYCLQLNAYFWIPSVLHIPGRATEYRALLKLYVHTVAVTRPVLIKKKYQCLIICNKQKQDWSFIKLSIACVNSNIQIWANRSKYRSQLITYTLKIKLKNVSRSQTRTDENAIILLLGKFKHIKCQYANLRLIFDIKICNWNWYFWDFEMPCTELCFSST